MQEEANIRLPAHHFCAPAPVRLSSPTQGASQQQTRRTGAGARLEPLPSCPRLPLPVISAALRGRRSGTSWARFPEGGNDWVFTPCCGCGTPIRGGVCWVGNPNQNDTQNDTRFWWLRQLGTKSLGMSDSDRQAHPITAMLQYGQGHLLSVDALKTELLHGAGTGKLPLAHCHPVSEQWLESWLPRF